jgi:hypothetical protein
MITGRTHVVGDGSGERLFCLGTGGRSNEDQGEDENSHVGVVRGRFNVPAAPND